MKTPAIDAVPVRAPIAVAAIAVAWLAAGCTGSRRAPVTTTRADPTHAVAIDSARAVLRVAARPSAGVAAAVYRDGEPVWLEGIGWADVAAGIAVDPVRTRFRIYSVVKPMTAAAALRLVEAGQLDPAAPIGRLVPGLPEAYAAITAIQLGTHTSGIRHYADASEARDPGHCETVDDALPIFVADPLVQVPGAGESYSSWGFVLLSAVIARAAGQPFQTAMEQLVFEPATMDGVTVDDPTVDVPHRAAPYERPALDAELRPAPGVDNTCKWGAGGFVATADDLARFGAALLDGSLVAERGLGMFLKGSQTYAAQGVGAGGTALLRLDATSGTVIVLVGNTSGEPPVAALREGMEALAGLF